MPRKPRFSIAGVPQHIIQRGNNQQATFFADEDYRFYLVPDRKPDFTHGGKLFMKPKKGVNRVWVSVVV